MNQNLRLQSIGQAEIPSSSILTFGGNMKTAGQCFTVNGDVGSLEIGAETPGSVFVVGIPFTIHVIAWHTPSTQTSGIQFLKNGQIYGPSWGIASAGLMGGMEGKWPYMYNTGDILQIRYSRPTEQRRHLVWVYVRPIAAHDHGPNEGALVDVSGQSIVTFGGDASPPSTRFLRVNGKARTVLGDGQGDLGNVYFVETDLNLHVVTWATQSGDETTTFAIIKNGTILVTFMSNGQIGMLPISGGVILFRPGDTIQVRHIDGAWPGPCLLTFYM
jgi:hypothetical protein